MVIVTKMEVDGKERALRAYEKLKSDANMLHKHGFCCPATTSMWLGRRSCNTITSVLNILGMQNLSSQALEEKKAWMKVLGRVGGVRDIEGIAARMANGVKSGGIVRTTINEYRVQKYGPRKDHQSKMQVEEQVSHPTVEPIAHERSVPTPLWGHTGKIQCDVGLINLGSSCFLNSIVQLLCSDQGFLRAVDGVSIPPSNPITLTFLKTVRRMIGKKTGTLVPESLWNSRAGLGNEYAGTEQQDAQLVMASLFRVMFDDRADRECGVIQKLKNRFRGEFVDKITCNACGNSTCKEYWEELCRFSVPCPSSCVQDGLDDDFLGLERNTLPNYKCDHCHKKSHCDKTKAIRTPPEVLIVNILRFRYIGKTQIKQEQEVICDGTINLPLENGKMVAYNKRAIIRHHGGSMTNGHYTTLRINDDGRCAVFDDDKVNSNAALSDLDAFVLLYERDLKRDTWDNACKDVNTTREEEIREVREKIPMAANTEPNEELLVNQDRMNGSDIFVALNRKQKLTREEAHKILTAASSTDQYVIADKPPYYIKNGNVYLYRLKYDGDYDYHCDQVHKWDQKGTGYESKKEVVRMKRSNLLVNNKQVPGVHRYVYCIKDEDTKRGTLVLIQYIGDEKYLISRPYGGSKNGKPFAWSTKEVRIDIKKSVQTKSGPTSIFEAGVQKARRDLGPEFDQYAAVMAPRNTRQVTNHKSKATTANRIDKDAVVAIYQMSEARDGQFVLAFALLPKLKLIIADPSILDFAKKLLALSAKRQELPQILSYDTTFGLTDFYVSVLEMRNVVMKKDPIFPVAFLIHRNKDTEAHEFFWEEMNRKLDLCKLGGKLIYICDKEEAIRKAMRKVIPDMKLYMCTLHLRRHLKDWMRKHPNALNGQPMSNYLADIDSLLNSTNASEWDFKFDRCTSRWPNEFTEYIVEFKKEDLWMNSRHSYSEVAAFATSPPTTNISESENSRIKKYVGTTQLLKLDLLCLALHQGQLFQLSNFHLSFGASGNHVPKPGYLDWRKHITLPSYVGLDQNRFVALLNGQLQEKKAEVVERHGILPSSTLQALIMFEKDMVKLVGSKSMFVVDDPWKKTALIVKFDQKTKTYKCSCGARGACSHVKSVYCSIGLPLEEQEGKVEYPGIADSMKRRLGKSGRKKPILGDMDFTRRTNLRDDDDTFIDVDKLLEEQDWKEIEDELQSADSEFQNTQQDPIYHSTPKSGKLSGTSKKQDIGSNSKSAKKKSDIIDKTELTGSEVEDGLCVIVGKANVGDTICVSPLVMWEYVKDDQIAKMIQLAGNYEILDQDLLFQPVLLTVRGNGHWVLGVISFSQELICVLDSARPSNGTSVEVFNKLYTIAAAVAASGRLHLARNNWKIYQGDDMPQQKGNYECGDFVLMAAEAVCSKVLLKNCVLKDHRKWVREILNDEVSLKKGTKNKSKVVYKPSMLEQLVKLVRLDRSWKQADIKVNAVSEDLNDLFVRLSTSWTVCGAAEGCTRDSHNEKAQDMCVACRRWFHAGCQNMNSFENNMPRYFYCQRCFPRLVPGYLQNLRGSEHEGEAESMIGGEVTITEEPCNLSGVGRFIGAGRGIRGTPNSSCVDSIIIALFHSTNVLDHIMLTRAGMESEQTQKFKKHLLKAVNILRSAGISDNEMKPIHEMVKEFNLSDPESVLEVMLGVCLTPHLWEYGNDDGDAILSTQPSGTKIAITSSAALIKHTMREKSLKIATFAANSPLFIAKMPWAQGKLQQYKYIIPSLYCHMDEVFLQDSDDEYTFTLMSLIFVEDGRFVPVVKCGRTDASVWLKFTALPDQTPEVKRMDGLQEILATTKTANVKELCALNTEIAGILSNLYLCIYTCEKDEEIA